MQGNTWEKQGAMGPKITMKYMQFIQGNKGDLLGDHVG